MEPTWRGLIHGEAKVGKSRLAATGPKPMLILDAEGRSRFLSDTYRIRYWNPLTEATPMYDGTWDICVVDIIDFNTVRTVYAILRSGQHQFRTVVLDSIMEIQKRCVDTIQPGTRALERDDYGQLLREVDKLVREFRDLTLIPSNNTNVVILVCGTRQDKTEKYAPMLQGAMADWLPYYVDTVGFLHKAATPTGLVRALLVDEQPGFVAGDGTNRLKTAYGPIIYMPEDGTQWIENWMPLFNGLNQNDGVAVEGGTTV